MAYGIQNLQQALQGSQPPRQDVQRLSRMGMGGDDTMAHLTSGEMVVPKEFQSPGIMSLIAGKMRQRGTNPSEYIVGTPSAQANANPYTGAQQFKYGSDTSEGGATGGPGEGGRDGGGGLRGVVDRIDSWKGSTSGKAAAAGLAAGGIPGAIVGGLGGYAYDKLKGMDWGGSTNAFDRNIDPRDGRDGGIGRLGRRGKLSRREQRMSELMGDQSSAFDLSGYQTTPPEDIDYLRYGELTPEEGGGEKLMYPWEHPGGVTTYGQYPLFGGISGFGPAPRPDGSEDLDKIWGDRRSPWQ